MCIRYILYLCTLTFLLLGCSSSENDKWTTITIIVMDDKGNLLSNTTIQTFYRNWTGGSIEGSEITNIHGEVSYDVIRHDSETPLAEWHEFRVEREGYYSQVQIAIPTQERVDVIFVLAPRSVDNVLGRPPK